MSEISIGDFAYSRVANKLIKVTSIKGNTIEGVSVVSRKSGHVITKTVYQFDKRFDKVEKFDKPSSLKEESYNGIGSLVKQMLQESLATRLDERRSDRQTMQVHFANKTVAREARDDWKGEDVKPGVVEFPVKSLDDAEKIVKHMEKLYKAGSIKYVNYPD